LSIESASAISATAISTTTTSPPPTYPLQHLQFNEFFYEEKLRNLIYQHNDFEDDYENEGIVYERRRRFTNSNLNRRGEFPNPNRRGRFPNSIREKGGYSNPDEFRIPSFDESLDIESSLIWIDEVDKLFDMAYIFIENYVKFATYKLKGRAAVWWNQLQNIYMQQVKLLIRTLRRMKRLLQGKFLPPDYHQTLFKQFESCSQGIRTTNIYTEELYFLSSHYRLVMT